MKLVVFGANGNIGQSIVAEALSRGYSVTAAIRYPYKMPRLGDQLSTQPVDVLDVEQVSEAVRDAGAVVTAIGGLGHDNPRISYESALVIMEGMRKAAVRRFVIVGTAGTLRNPDGGERMDAPGFPAVMREEAQSQRDLQDHLKGIEAADIEWTYFAPPIEIEPGTRTGNYRLGNDDLLFGEDGRSYISNQDYAVALIDEIDQPRFICRRFTAVSG